MVNRSSLLRFCWRRRLIFHGSGRPVVVWVSWRDRLNNCSGCGINTNTSHRCVCSRSYLQRGLRELTGPSQIIVSSPRLGVFPATFPSRDRVDWLPVDKLSSILIEILASSCDTPHVLEGGTHMYHVVNPKTTSWKANLAKEVLSLYPPSINVQPVLFEEWLRAVGESAAEMDRDGTLQVDRIPAIRLLDFYSGASKPGQEPRSFISSRAEKASKTLREIEPVNGEWVSRWMAQWGIASDQGSTP